MPKEPKNWKKEEFRQLCFDIKKWFEDRNIDFGYTDTNIGHLAIFIQDKLESARKEQDEKWRKKKLKEIN